MRATRKLNFTNRRKIEQSEVQITLQEKNGAPPTFSASFDFKSQLAPNARLFVEAYCNDTTQRFDYGRVSAPMPPENLTLNEINLGGNILFRVKVIDDAHSRALLIASAEKIQPVESDDKSRRGSLMTIKSVDLGQRTWAVDFSDDEIVVLLVNKRIPEAISRINSDPVFNGLIIPQVMREVLLNLVWENEDLESEDGWKSRWKEFIQSFAPDDIPTDGDTVEILSWVDDTVSEFCERFQFCDALVDHLGDDE